LVTRSSSQTGVPGTVTQWSAGAASRTTSTRPSGFEARLKDSSGTLRIGRGLSSSELLSGIVRACATPPVFIVLDDADFAENEMIDELLFALSRRTQSFTVIVAQNFRFLERLSDSVRSSLLPRVLIFQRVHAGRALPNFKNESGRRASFSRRRVAQASFRAGRARL